MSSASSRHALIAVLLGLAWASVVHAQTSAVPGAARVYSTIYSIGIEWDLAGDTNHNAAGTVDYRVHGASAWTPALPLVRVDYNGSNMLAGSILFLTPDTPYDLRLALGDPDGGAEVRVLSVSTLALPAMPTGGRTLEVVPGSGGGSGSTSDPFRGIGAAQAVARPGDIFVLHAGSYGGRIRLDKAGTPGNYIVWRGAGDGEVALDGIDIAASHVWLEGLTVRNQAYATFSISAPTDVVVRRCGFYGNHYSIYLQQGGSNWYIADNTIVGDTAYATESFDGEGIELNSTSGHTVAHNSITNVADGVSYPLSNVDIFGNDIFDTSDDGIEGDYGYANVRIWGNRIHNAVHNGISFQPQNGAPWYILRNQIVSNMEGAFKFRTTDRFVLAHNTIVNWGTAWPGDAMICCNEDHLMRAFARNNLWISVQGGQVWGFDTFVKDWRTDLDFDGFDWGDALNPFSYGGATFPDLPSFSGASGLETNGVRLSKSDCFETFDVPSPPKNPVPPQSLTLTAGCAAVDRGAVLPNINDGRFDGLAPDLGAFERGQPVLTFGPRGEPTATVSVWPPTTAAGQSAVLSWTTTDASSVTIDQGVGAVAASGWRTIAPTSTTIYTLTAIGPGGTVTATARVTVGPVGVPAAPAGLTAAAVSESRIDLAWTDMSDNEAGFTLEQSINGAAFVPLAQLAANATTFSAIGLSPSTTYAYRIRAFNAAGASAYSPSATATTLAAPLRQPTGLTATAVGPKQVNLAWTDNASGEAGYQVERSSNAASFSLVATVPADTRTFSDRKVTGGKTYSYRVRAYTATAASPYSNTATVVTPRR